MKNSQKQWLYIIAIMLSVAGLALGFAAFSNTLTIKSSATVTPSSENFSVKFSSSGTEFKEDEIIPTKMIGTAQTATNAIINNSTKNPTLSNLNVTFTEPDQWVEYTVYVYNAGEYTAYLDTSKLNDYPEVTCTIPEGSEATQSLVDAACKSIDVTVNVGGSTSIEPGEFTRVSVTIANYDIPEGSEEPTVRADGEFIVNVEDITMYFTSANPNE